MGRRLDQRAIGRVDGVEEARGGGGGAVGVEPEDAIELRRPAELVGDDVPVPAAERRKLLSFSELCLAPAQALLGLDAHADVAREGRGSDDAARLVPDRGHRDRDVDPAPVLGHALGVDLADGLTRAHAGEQAAGSTATLRRYEHRDRGAQRLLRRIAVQPLRGRVPIRDQAVEREADDRILGVLDQRGRALQCIDAPARAAVHDGRIGARFTRRTA